MTYNSMIDTSKYRGLSFAELVELMSFAERQYISFRSTSDEIDQKNLWSKRYFTLVNEIERRYEEPNAPKVKSASLQKRKELVQIVDELQDRHMKREEYDFELWGQFRFTLVEVLEMIPDAEAHEWNLKNRIDL